MKISQITTAQNLQRGGGKSAQVQANVPTEKDPGLWKAAKGFESMFMGHLLKTMQESLPEESAGGGGMAGMMFSQVMGDAMAENGGIGLADMLYRELQASIPGASGPSKGSGGISIKKLVLPDVGGDRDEE